MSDKTAKEKEPVPWAELERYHSIIDEALQPVIANDWLSSSRTAPVIGELSRRYDIEWSIMWRYVRLVIPARERRRKKDAARARRAARKA